MDYSDGCIATQLRGARSNLRRPTRAAVCAGSPRPTGTKQSAGVAQRRKAQRPAASNPGCLRLILSSASESPAPVFAVPQRSECSCRGMDRKGQSGQSQQPAGEAVFFAPPEMSRVRASASLRDPADANQPSPNSHPALRPLRPARHPSCGERANTHGGITKESLLVFATWCYSIEWRSISFLPVGNSMQQVCAYRRNCVTGLATMR
jgi:hypothetical protein